ncbi:plasmid pRiA4b ORF-3 family protein [Pelagivirga sediminicola]|uniref:Plasmid pRiA4b ORF-3 family protein n=1 Tax=Pelagivirga sediminicola TaxID=2170575 RepID=A0A2T7G2L2_9RHOB|nr:plasmid pRiA4b ORF-3 family protein [Pelagivirga sediminicola]
MKADTASVLQLKIRLLGISPMVWRRVVVAEEMSLRDLHGVVQAVMGWDGIHLFEFNIQGARYTSPNLCGEPTSKMLSAFRFRKNAKFRYIYDMGAWWEHEVRVEDRFTAVVGKRYPMCIGGAGACPPEDCGGVHGYLARREEATGLDAYNDLDTLIDFIDRAVLKGDPSVLDDEDQRWRIEMAVERSGSRIPFLEAKFSRQAVNKGLRADEHRRLMHQQVM